MTTTLAAYNSHSLSKHGHGHRRHSQNSLRKKVSNILDGDRDPLDIVTRPPENETQSQKLRRVKEESCARAISEAIDEDISRQRHARRKMKTVKLLLLGQSS